MMAEEKASDGKVLEEMDESDAQACNQRGSMGADEPPLSRECNLPEGSHCVAANWLKVYRERQSTSGMQCN